MSKFEEKQWLISAVFSRWGSFLHWRRIFWKNVPSIDDVPAFASIIKHTYDNVLNAQEWIHLLKRLPEYPKEAAKCPFRFKVGWQCNVALCNDPYRKAQIVCTFQHQMYSIHTTLNAYQHATEIHLAFGILHCFSTYLPRRRTTFPALVIYWTNHKNHQRRSFKIMEKLFLRFPTLGMLSFNYTRQTLFNSHSFLREKWHNVGKIICIGNLKSMVQWLN